MKFLSLEKRYPGTILFVNISLATVTSSTVTSLKLNVENSTKARYVDETHSYRFLKFEINKSNKKKNMKTMLNHGKLCKTISTYIIKRSLHLYGNILCPRKLGQLCQKNSFNTVYSHTSAITYNVIVYRSLLLLK